MYMLVNDPEIKILQRFNKMLTVTSVDHQRLMEAMNNVTPVRLLSNQWCETNFYTNECNRSTSASPYDFDFPQCPTFTKVL